MTPQTPPAAPPPAEVNREIRPGLAITRVHRRQVSEYNLALWPVPGESSADLVGRLDGVLRETGARVAKHDVFGSLAAHPAVLDGLRRRPGGCDWPVMWIEGAACDGHELAGMHLLAIAGTEVESLAVDGRVVGRIFSTGQARHCLLGDLRPPDLSRNRPHQAFQTFQALETALIAAGMKLADVARTWLFLDDILSWYGPLNQARQGFFEQKQVFLQGLPASTGVGARNPAGSAVVAGAWALQDTCGGVTVRVVPSPLQCPAPRYGSCFSRAIEVTAPTHRRLLISGTASIHPDGTSAHFGDPVRQVDLTMEVTEAILGSRGFGFGDVTRATAYFRRPADAPVFARWLKRRGLALPLVMTNATICRDELLFEIEVEAVATRGATPTVAA